MRVLISLIMFFPSILSAQSIFSDDEDYSAKKEENSLLGSFFGSTQESTKQSWGRFKPLEEYGQSPAPIAQEKLPPDPAEIKAAQDYYNSKDPFSNSNRLEQVYENLNPEKQGY